MGRQRLYSVPVSPDDGSGATESMSSQVRLLAPVTGSQPWLWICSILRVQASGSSVEGWGIHLFIQFATPSDVASNKLLVRVTRRRAKPGFFSAGSSSIA